MRLRLSVKLGPGLAIMNGMVARSLLVVGAVFLLLLGCDSSSTANRSPIDDDGTATIDFLGGDYTSDFTVGIDDPTPVTTSLVMIQPALFFPDVVFTGGGMDTKRVVVTGEPGAITKLDAVPEIYVCAFHYPPEELKSIDLTGEGSFQYEGPPFEPASQPIPRYVGIWAQLDPVCELQGSGTPHYNWVYPYE